MKRRRKPNIGVRAAALEAAPQRIDPVLGETGAASARALDPLVPESPVSELQPQPEPAPVLAAVPEPVQLWSEKTRGRRAHSYSSDRSTVTHTDGMSAVRELQSVQYRERLEPQAQSQVPSADAAVAAAEPEADGDSAAALARIVILTGGSRVHEIQLKIGRIVVGRTPDNDVQIESEFISRHHCQVVTTAHGSVIEDLKSTNGTYVKSVRVPRYQLSDGDVVQIGKHELIYMDCAGRERAVSGEAISKSITSRKVTPTISEDIPTGQSKPKTYHPWLWAAVCVAALVGIWVYWHVGAARTPQLLTAPVMRGHIENSVLVSGVLQPSEFVDVGAQVSGQLKHLFVKLGDTIKKGQLLAEIDPEISAAKVVEAEATLANLQAQLRGEKGKLELARLQKERNDELQRQGANAASESEIADSNYKVQDAAVASLEAQVKDARAALATARTSLGYTRITAPMAGDVVSITAREGQTLNANQTTPTILRIGQLDTMTVWALVPEADVPRLRLGQEVYFSILGQSEQKWYSKLRQILPSPEIISNVVFYDALFDVKNPQRALKVQMTAQVFFVLQQADNALYVPTGALHGLKSDQTGQAAVRVLKANGSIEKRTVKVGIRNLVAAQILEGLKEGDTVVVGQAAPKEKRGKTGALHKVSQ